MNEIEQALIAAKKLRCAADNMLDNWSEGNRSKKNELWQRLHRASENFLEHEEKALQALASLQGNEGALKALNTIVNDLFWPLPEGHAKVLMKHSEIIRAALQQGAWMPEEKQKLERVADVAAKCTIDLTFNLNTAHKEYMAGDIPRGAYEHILARHAAIHDALHDAGYTEKHKIFEYPVKPTPPKDKGE